VLLSSAHIFVPSTMDNVGEGVMFLGCPLVPYVRSFIRSNIVTTMSQTA